MALSYTWKEFRHVADTYKTKDEFGIVFDGEAMWEDLRERFGAYPSGNGELLFETEQGELMFLLTFTKQTDDNSIV